MSKKNAMKDKLNEFKTKRNALTPTEALNQPLEESIEEPIEEPKEEVGEKNNTNVPVENSVPDSENVESTNAGNPKMQSLLQKKKKIEDTHTRRTFLVRNELLTRLDSYAKKIGNSGFKTEFINIVIEEGLAELERNKKK